MAKVYEFLATGFEELEALAPVDILRRGGMDVTTVSVIGSLFVESSHGVTIKADRLLEDVDLDDADLLLLPGGMPGSKNLNAHEGVRQALLDHAAKGRLIGAICAAPIALHRNGLIDGKTVTCYPGCGDDFDEAAVVEETVVMDGKLITSRGPGTAIEFGLKLLEVLKGKDVADEVRAKLLA